MTKLTIDLCGHHAGNDSLLAILSSGLCTLSHDSLGASAPRTLETDFAAGALLENILSPA
jgi:hypothetical protein